MRWRRRRSNSPACSARSLWPRTWRALAASAGGSGLGGDVYAGTDDGAFAGGAGLAVVADEEMFDDFVDAGVLQACELGVFIKGKVARAPDEAQAAEDSASFALEGI
jgi:hypothetical protein